MRTSPIPAGFTLIEAMIVVVIIGVLASIAIPKFNGSRRTAYIATMRSDLRNLVAAEELFYSDSSRYTEEESHLNVRPSAHMTVRLAVGPGYWTATATHAQITDGFSCAIAVNTQNPLVETAPEGQPACVGAKGATATPPSSP
jgi:prepilin-type N-terminal cleavage/methylation domain-containing protein